MTKPQLVIMAAGLGSRYGGIKQMASVDDEGHFIIDFSTFDALRAGFEDVIFIVKPELEADIRDSIGARVSRHARVRYAPQAVSMIPAGFSLPAGRTKPWGTGHAVLCARKFIEGPFAVINADDFYGRTAFEAMHAFLTEPGDEREHAIVGYRLRNTLSESGAVSRGVCRVGKSGELERIVERTHIEVRNGGAVYSIDGGRSFRALDPDSIVSMNLWGFKPSIMPEIARRFERFLADSTAAEPLSREFYLPSVPDALIQEGRARVRLLSTSERWFGITYPQDLAAVRAAIAQKKAAGEYPRMLWT